MRPPPTVGAHPTGPLPVAVTMGDPVGIGPDITLLGWCAREAHAVRAFAVYGVPELLSRRAHALGLDVPVAPIDRLAEATEIFARALPVLRPAATMAALTGDTDADDADIVAAIEGATAATLRGEALALVTNPIAKRSLRAIPLEYPGHTAFLGQ